MGSIDAVLHASAYKITWMCFARVIAGLKSEPLTVAFLCGQQKSVAIEHEGFLGHRVVHGRSTSCIVRTRGLLLITPTASRMLTVSPWHTGSSSSRTSVPTRSWHGGLLRHYNSSLSSLMALASISSRSLPDGLWNWDAEMEPGMSFKQHVKVMSSANWPGSRNLSSTS